MLGFLPPTPRQRLLQRSAAGGRVLPTGLFNWWLVTCYAGVIVQAWYAADSLRLFVLALGDRVNHALAEAARSPGDAVLAKQLRRARVVGTLRDLFMLLDDCHTGSSHLDIAAVDPSAFVDACDQLPLFSGPECPALVSAWVQVRNDV